MALDVETIFSEPRIEGTRPTAHSLSPDEKWVAYVWNDSGYRSPLNLYVVKATGGDPIQLTHFVRDSVNDSLRQEWKKLRAGDAQIIRSGGGISHSEKFHLGSHIFQIWMDHRNSTQGLKYNLKAHQTKHKSHVWNRLRETV